MRPENLNDNRKDDEDGVATVVSVVYVTAKATFAGSTAGFVTEGLTTTAKTTTPTVQPNKTTQNANTQTTAAATSDTTSAETIQSTAKPTKAAHTSVSSILSSITSDSQTTSAPSTLATSTSRLSQIGAAQAATQASSSATATPSETSAPGSGMSGGAKAGIAFAFLALAALAAGGLILCLRRKRKQRKEEGLERIEDEKSGAAFGLGEKSTTSSRAPRVSLRPMTQLMSNIGDPKISEMTSATGGLALASHSKPVSTWDTRPSSGNSANSANPFSNSASVVDHAAADKAAENAPIPVPAVTTLNPFDDRARSPESGSPPSTPNSPPRAEIGTAAAVPMGANPPRGPQNNVHRVQLDFKPSMDDELDLRAGQVVRVLHEYDDGWVSPLLTLTRNITDRS